MSDSFKTIVGKNLQSILLIVFALVFSSIALGIQRTGLSVHSQSLTGLFSGYIIVSAAISLAFFGGSKAIGNYYGGIISQKFGPNRASQLGALILISGGLLLATTETNVVFMIGNGILGLGIGLLFASSAIALVEISSVHHRAKAISSMELSVYIGTATGSFIAGRIAESSGFDDLFPIAFFFTLLTIIVIPLLRDTRIQGSEDETTHFPTARQKLDVLKNEWHDNPDIEELEELFKLFIPITERQIGDHSGSKFSRKVFFRPSFLITYSSGIVSRISDTAMIIIFPLLILKYGFSAFELGIFVTIFTLFWSVGIGISGPIADTLGRKIPLGFGLIMEMVGFVFLFLLGLNDWLPMIVLSMVIAGLGRGLYFPIPASVSTDLVPSKYKAYSLGLYRFFLDMGYIVGAFLIILIVEFRPGVDDDDIKLLEPVMTIIILIIFIQFIAVLLFFKDPRPGFRQLDAMKKHLSLVKESFFLLTHAIDSYIEGNREGGKVLLSEAKSIERKADVYIEQMTRATYSGAWRATDAFELLQFSTKIDKSLGYSIRSVRKLFHVEEKLPSAFRTKLRYYSRLLELLIETTEETFNLISIKLYLAVEQSYQVNFVEEFLDIIHKQLWEELLKNSEKISPLSLMLLTSVIESLEKSANILEDAAEIIRLISFKH